MRKSDMTPKIDIWDSTIMIFCIFPKCSLDVFVMSRHALMTGNVPKPTLTSPPVRLPRHSRSPNLVARVDAMVFQLSNSVLQEGGKARR